jgi:hypothetical protein
MATRHHIGAIDGTAMPASVGAALILRGLPLLIAP